MRKPFDSAAFVAKHEAEVSRLRKDLVESFSASTQTIINMAFSQMGERRFVGTDDRWEQITAHLNGWDYNPPPAHLIARWRMA